MTRVTFLTIKPQPVHTEEELKLIRKFPPGLLLDAKGFLLGPGVTQQIAKKRKKK